MLLDLSCEVLVAWEGEKSHQQRCRNDYYIWQRAVALRDVTIP
jgi:hypothetical protein